MKKQRFDLRSVRPILAGALTLPSRELDYLILRLLISLFRRSGRPGEDIDEFASLFASRFLIFARDRHTASRLRSVIEGKLPGGIRQCNKKSDR